MSYLFTRSLRLAPSNLVDSMAWSIKMTEKVNQIAEIKVSLWSPVMSPQINTLIFSAVVEDLSLLTATDEKLMADAGYLDLVQEGSKYTADTGVDDQLMRIIHADPDAGDSSEYASVVRAVVTPGSFVDGITLGVEIAQRAKAITGRPVQFGQATTGVYGEVGWIALYDSIEQVQAADEALGSDADFAALLDAKAAKAYLPGHSKQRISRKLA